MKYKENESRKRNFHASGIIQKRGDEGIKGVKCVPKCVEILFGFIFHRFCIYLSRCMWLLPVEDKLCECRNSCFSSLQSNTMPCA